MATLLNGRELALNLRNELKQKISASHLTPCLGVILVGDDPASHLYVSLKEQAAKEVGIAVEKKLMPNSTTTAEVIKQVKEFNANSNINGILIQLPLPPAINEHAVINELDPAKDADGFHPTNLANLLNNNEAVVPGVSVGIMKLITLSQQSIANKTANLIVNSDEFAQPLKKLLEDAEVSVHISRQPEKDLIRNADIIIVALGQPMIIKSDLIKDGAIVIDVGTTKVNGKILGDVEATGLTNRHVFLTPVPGGVGPMTVVMLLWNVFELARRQA